MIIQIAGTNGAGKSTAMQAVLAKGTVVQEHPDWCELQLRACPRIAVVGRYGHRVSGGCDIFKNVSEIHDAVRRSRKVAPVVLWEGGTSHGGLNQTKGPQLVQELRDNYVVILLTTRYADCLDGINQRRAASGEPPLRDDQHIRSNYTRAQNYAARMRDVGAIVHRCSREQTPAKILELLRAAP